jgi:hypothetical protein
MIMLRKTVLVTLALAGLCGPASAGVLSFADLQRLRAYEEDVVPASREIPGLHQMATRLDAMIEARDGGSLAEFSDLPPMGGPTLEMMIASLKDVADGSVRAALLAELRSAVAARLAYDADLLAAYQRSVAKGAAGLSGSFVRWEERPETAARRSRFEALLARQAER